MASNHTHRKSSLADFETGPLRIHCFGDLWHWLDIETRKTHLSKKKTKCFFLLQIKKSIRENSTHSTSFNLLLLFGKVKKKTNKSKKTDTDKIALKNQTNKETAQAIFFELIDDFVVVVLLVWLIFKLHLFKILCQSLRALNFIQTDWILEEMTWTETKYTEIKLIKVSLDFVDRLCSTHTHTHTFRYCFVFGHTRTHTLNGHDKTRTHLWRSKIRRIVKINQRNFANFLGFWKHLLVSKSKSNSCQLTIWRFELVSKYSTTDIALDRHKTVLNEMKT